MLLYLVDLTVTALLCKSILPIFSYLFVLSCPFFMIFLRMISTLYLLWLA